MFRVGQRWFSEGEPELGLGIVAKIDGRTVAIHFPLSEQNRIYNAKNSPLKRFVLACQDELKDVHNQLHLIDEVQEHNHLLSYRCADQVIPEQELASQLDLGGPLQRLFARSFDTIDFFKLRYDAALAFRQYQEFKYKGFLSAKIRLLPHQVYVVHEVLNMPRPKVMLCDEVGLGKTIEAALILNALIQQELVQSALIIVPESLINQWFIELYKKFNLSFQNIEEIQTPEELDNAQFCLIASQTLKENEDYRQLLLKKKWGMLIIDEAHQFHYGQDEDEAIQCLKSLNSNSFGTLFLSATPEVLGIKNLYEQLHFLDPLKFTCFEDFQSTLTTSLAVSQLIESADFTKEHKDLTQFFSSSELAKYQDSASVKQALIDRFGTGRNYFRNSRKNLEKYSKLFNKRVLHAYPLNIEGAINDSVVLTNKLHIVYDIIQKYPHQKILVICHAKKVVKSLHLKLQELGNFKMATFHSEQSLLERDRQAAYFADEEGAQILLSTEVGSEGRNFEFAHHLILFDLPKLPDQLEQRIGRLDRIGQTQDINIHIPYIAKTFEEILFKWYHHVFNGLESSPVGSNEYHEKHHQELKDLIANPYDTHLLKSFILRHQKGYQVYKKELVEGRDHLIELNSYNDRKAKDIVNQILLFESKNSALHFLENIFDSIQIKHEELNEQSFHIAPTDNMLIPSYPGIEAEGFSCSYQRDYCQRFDHLQFMSWEHPIVKNGFEMLLNSPLGSCTIAKQTSLPRNIYFEFIIVLFCSDQLKHLGSLYLPYTPLRIFMNLQGEDLTKKYPKKLIDQNIIDAAQESTDIIAQIPKEQIQALYKKADLLALKKKEILFKKAYSKLEEDHQREVTHLNNLSLASDIKKQHLEQLKTQLNQLEQTLKAATLSMDSLRVILPIE